jgi:thiosulfate reductase cytochrome b subunit
MSTLGSAQEPLEMPVPGSTPMLPASKLAPRHSVLVRLSHWITALCFFALLLSGAELVVSHPRFYWGETGNVLTEPLFKLPVPSSRNLVPTGYGYVLPDQNGWSRALHFQTAWVLLVTGFVYVIAGFATGHFRKSLIPAKSHLSSPKLANVIVQHLRFERPSESEASSYNPLQRLAYLAVIFVLFPLIIWTGLAMSPAFDSAIPATVNLLGGRQSARTIHFLVSFALVLFVLLHVGLVWRAGFKSRMRAMITGRTNVHGERT